MATDISLPRLGQGMEAGTIVRWLKSEGDNVEKGEPLYELDTDKVTQEVEADEDEQEEGSPAPAREEERERGREAAKEDAEQEETARANGRVKASPLARRIARERGIDLASLNGTGPEGRIVAEDVERAAAAPAHATIGAAPLEAEVVPLTSLRKTIARRLTEAWQAPAFQISMSADMTRAQELHERLRDQGVSVTDILTKLAAVA